MDPISSKRALERKLLAAIAPHDLLAHPFYQAWSMGSLSRDDLARYAAQYGHQVAGLPSLLAAARAATADAETRQALTRNLDEEEGRLGPAHRELWLKFAEGMGTTRAAVDATPADAETAQSGAALRALCGRDEVSALAALWTYEAQTARVATSKREGLVQRYGVQDAGTLSFFKLHEELDVHHADDLLSALDRACGGDEAREAAACAAAAQSAQAQWLFLDGVERARLSAQRAA